MYVSLKTTLNVLIPGYFTSYHISVDSIQDAGKYTQSISICSVIAIASILSEIGDKEVTLFEIQEKNESARNVALCVVTACIYFEARRALQILHYYFFLIYIMNNSSKMNVLCRFFWRGYSFYLHCNFVIHVFDLLRCLYQVYMRNTGFCVHVGNHIHA